MRDWKEVFAELGKDFDVKDLRNLTEEIEKASNGNYAGKNGNEKKAQPYAPIWVYRKRLDQVLSIMGYRVNVTNPCIQHAQKRNIDILTVQGTSALRPDGSTAPQFIAAIKEKYPYQLVTLFSLAPSDFPS